jgi:hypothetical protein
LRLSAVSWQVGSSSLLDGTELEISKMQGRRCMLHSGVGGGPVNWPTLGPPTPNFVATVHISALVEVQSSLGPEQQTYLSTHFENEDKRKTRLGLSWADVLPASMATEGIKWLGVVISDGKPEKKRRVQ